MPARPADGHRTNGTVAFTFGLGAALAAVGAMLWRSYPMITPFIGSMLGLKAFVAAVLGGIGISRRHDRRYIMGIAESLTKDTFPRSWQTPLCLNFDCRAACETLGHHGQEYDGKSVRRVDDEKKTMFAYLRNLILVVGLYAI
ncbi:MAG: ABC transporter permease subunit [Christensenellales bacterium]